MTKAQESKAKVFYRMGYRSTDHADSGLAWVARDMPNGKTIFQGINDRGETVKTMSRPTEKSNGKTE